jgi:hypothetical protein
MKMNVRGRTGLAVAIALVALLTRCGDDDDPLGPAFDRPVDPALVAQGREIFRFDTFGNEVFWTDTLRLHQVIRSSVSPNTALGVGLKVDVDALPQSVRSAIQAGQVDLNSPASTVTLLKLGAVVGVIGTVQTVAGRDTLTRVGITRALCHSTVDNSFAAGIGKRLDGWPNRDLNVGAIVALSPVPTAAQKAVYSSWGRGMYDPRFNIDGRNVPVVIPPAFGLRQVKNELYTGDDTISYWNRYVAVTQMHGQGSFVDARLGINLVRTPDLVQPKLAALRDYQHSLATRPAPATSVDAAAARRGRVHGGGALRLVSLSRARVHRRQHPASTPRPRPGWIRNTRRAASPSVTARPRCAGCGNHRSCAAPTFTMAARRRWRRWWTTTTAGARSISRRRRSPISWNT